MTVVVAFYLLVHFFIGPFYLLVHFIYLFIFNSVYVPFKIISARKRKLVHFIYWSIGPYLIIFEPRHKKTHNVVSEQVRHKPSCTVTEAGSRQENSDLERRGTVLFV